MNYTLITTSVRSGDGSFYLGNFDFWEFSVYFGGDLFGRRFIVKRYLYQVPFSDYKPGLIDFLTAERRLRIMVQNQFVHKYYGDVIAFYKQLNAFYDAYAARMKEIVEVEKINLDNFTELLRLELYLFNITEIYQDASLLREGIPFETIMEEWVHKIDRDTINAYFDTVTQQGGSSDRKMFLNLLLEKKENAGQVWLIDCKTTGNGYKM